ncbi:WD40 repeat-like protein [Basidiobolus meristosporus CBS 931.73]|uniref:WD40 repeat-like protein n=1 Tax=Basidiobolus meristosporus CBS 931.73 TaxID=1314790 RepID=A0A1Y1WRT9_9FUNG|nr:WD40 repeat-like protein [Basidiobolus meristosporus CBS 931.73]ORX91082.1 WD40 repeat-like protein [Basidiobolus meristosporus CBS 931.73]|eukprot:ORX76260.1 WD40 repeat-like protein [Basidiobolus meristosporus CBS 931.73]
MRHRSNLLENLRARENGEYFGRESPLLAERRLYSNPTYLTERLTLTNILSEHTGCVNTVNWNETGELLVSGSDDTKLCIWKYPEGSLLSSIETDHEANIFCTKFMPSTNSQVVISCAGDNVVKVWDVWKDEGACRHTYKCNLASTKRIVTEPGNPYVFLTCSEDGTVRNFDLRESHQCQSVCRTNLVVNFRPYLIELNSITLNPIHPQYIAIGGGDPYVYLWDRRMVSAKTALDPRHQMEYCVKKFKPNKSKSDHVTAVKFSESNGRELLGSWSNDFVHLFDIHESKEKVGTEKPPTKVRRNSCTYLDSKRKKSRYAEDSESDDCELHTSEPSLDQTEDPSSEEDIDFNQLTELIQNDWEDQELLSESEGAQSEVGSEVEQGLDLITSRIMEANSDIDSSDVMEAIESFLDGDSGDESSDEDFTSEYKNIQTIFNSVIEEVRESTTYKGHCNVQTIKDVNFYGPNDEYVISGSDDGNFFIWDKKSRRIVQILKGDEDVVNCIQGHPFEPAIAVSGIDSTIKIFTPQVQGPHEEFEPTVNGAPATSPNHVWSSKSLLAREEEIVMSNENRRQEGIWGAPITGSFLRFLLTRAGAIDSSSDDMDQNS